MSAAREAISNARGKADMAYISLGVLVLACLFVMGFLSAMSAWDFGVCKDCRYDPLPLAQAIALISAAFFTTGFGGLAVYILAIRKAESEEKP